jgi:AcrR family transcriptional regulator
VTAAIQTWAADRNATLTQIAAAADVGRSTLHRYFADRAELLTAVDQESQRRFVVATERARPRDGSGLEACHRLCQEYLELGPVLGLVFVDNALVDPDTWSKSAGEAGAGAGEDDDPFGAAVLRGHRDRTVDPELPVGWAVTALWMLLYSAWLYSSTGQGSSREVSMLLVRTVAGAIGRAAPDG